MSARPPTPAPLLPRRTGVPRAVLLTLALCTSVSGTVRAEALSASSRPRVVWLAQAQPEAPVPSGQAFEEEIVPQRYARNPAVDAFINDMVARYDFDAATLHALFDQAVYSASAVQLVSPPSRPTVKNWQVYQSRFLEPVRVNAGARFWRDNRAALRRAQAQFGVPAEIIVGIIGVETLYGRYMGNFRVLDALATLTFDYPNTPNRAARETTFRKNLQDFLIWTREAGIGPASVLGSYTGAIGIPQFLPSSLVQYAVDFDGDNRVDVRNSPADAIGSVANYLARHGWQSGRPVVWHIAPDPGSQGIARAAANGRPEPSWQLEQLVRAGMLLDQRDIDIAAEASTPVTVVDLPTPSQRTQYVLGLNNFYVLTRYNRSFFYALAAWQLGQAVKSRLTDTGELNEQDDTSAAPALGNADSPAAAVPGGEILSDPANGADPAAPGALAAPLNAPSD